MSRFRSIAIAVGLILVETACNAAPSVSPASSSGAAASVPAATSSAPAPSATGPAPSQGDKFKGINVNILTFNGPQVAEPLQRRAPDWEKLTGGHVNVVAVGFQTIYDKALLDASTGTNAFDAYVFNPQWLGDFTGPGYLLDLTDRVNNDPQLDWQDIGPFFRDFNASYNGKVYTIQLDGDFHMVYYRKDILEKDSVSRRPRGTTTSRLPRSTTARTSTATASRTTARALPRRRAPRATGGSSRSPVACSRARAPMTERSSTRPT